MADSWFMFTSRNIPMESQNSPLHREIFQTSIFGLLCRWSPCCYAGATLQLVSMKRISNEIQQGVVRYSTCRKLRIPKKRYQDFPGSFWYRLKNPWRWIIVASKLLQLTHPKPAQNVFSAQNNFHFKQVKGSKQQKYKLSKKNKLINEGDISTLCAPFDELDWWCGVLSFRSWWSLSMELRM